MRYAHRIANVVVGYLRIGTTIVPIRNTPINTDLTKPYLLLWMSEHYPEPTKADASFRYFIGFSCPSGTWPFVAARREEAWGTLHSHWSESLGLEVMHSLGQLNTFVSEAYRVTTPEGINQPNSRKSHSPGFIRSATITQ